MWPLTWAVESAISPHLADSASCAYPIKRGNRGRVVFLYLEIEQRPDCSSVLQYMVSIQKNLGFLRSEN